MARKNFKESIFKVSVSYRHNNKDATFTRYYDANKNIMKISNEILEELRKISPEASGSATIKIEILD